MKFIFLFATFLVYSVHCYSQEFRKLRGSIAFGASDAFVASLEPSYRITDKILVGVRIEGKTGFNLGSKDEGSYGINSQYYFSKKRFRPFAGLGLSLYHTGIYGLYGSTSRNEKTVLGAYPRIGFDVGHFSLTIDWNIVARAKATIYESSLASPSGQAVVHDGYINGNYLVLKMGVAIGGGRKK